MFKLIAPLLGPLLQFGLSWFTKKNSAEIVKRAEAQNIQVNTDEIRTLIHTYHFGSTPERKKAALEELRRRGAMT